jgi:hypothetical protein
MHGFCFKGHQSFDVSVFDREKEPKSYVELPLNGTIYKGWDEGTHYLPSLTTTPCGGGTYFQPNRVETIDDGLVVEVTFTGGGVNNVTLCGMSEVVGEANGAKNDNDNRSGGWANTTRGLQADGFVLSNVINITDIAGGGNFLFSMNVFCRNFSASTKGQIYSFPQALSSTNDNKFTHGICMKNQVSASIHVLSRDDKFYPGSNRHDYANVTLLAGNSTPVLGWKDSTNSRVIGGFENSPCNGSTYLKPWEHETVKSGTSFKISVTGPGPGPVTFCAISEHPGGTPFAHSNTDRSGGWSNNVTGLVARHGFTQYPSLYYNEKVDLSDPNYTMNIFCKLLAV